jgi:hypothetical protein
VNWEEFSTLKVLNTELDKFVDAYNGRKHGTTQMPPKERWLQDGEFIRFAKPEAVEDAFMHRDERKVFNDATIRFDNDVFEVPSELAGQKVTIRYRPEVPVQELLVYGADGELKCRAQLIDRVANSKLKRKGIDYGSKGEEE